MSIIIKQSGSQGPKGSTGWSPELANVLDGVRIVQKVIDWYGGQGTKPPLNYYIGVGGFVTDIANALDIRGSIAYALINWRGAWSSATAYIKGDGVTSNGSSYACKLAHTNQALTNNTYWDVVASKGDAGVNGDNIRNLSGSVVKNGSLENFATNDISLYGSITLDLLPSFDIYPNLLVSENSFVTYTKKFLIDNKKLYRVSYYANQTEGSVGSQVSGRIMCYDKNNNLIVYDRSINSDANSVYGNYTSIALGSWKYYEHFYGGVFTSGTTNITRFHSSTVYAVGKFHVLTAGSKFKLSRFQIHEIELSTVVPSNLDFLPDGQRVYEFNNPIRRGIYYNSTVGIVWDTQQEITLQPNGTSVVFNLRRPYKFSWVVVYNDGVTIVSQPSATINANSDALLTLTGTAGKTLTISIQQTI